MSESADGCHIVSRNYSGGAIIWNRENGTIVWKSAHEHAPGNKVENDDAETIIRSCGQRIPQLWPNSFPACDSELYCSAASAHSILERDETLIAGVPNLASWNYHAEGKVLAAGGEFGAVAVCKFVSA